MNRSQGTWKNQLAELPLPESVHPMGGKGTEFDPRANLWCFRVGGVGISLNFSLLPPVTPAFLHGFKQAMIAASEKLAGGSVNCRFGWTLAILRHTAKHHSQPVDQLHLEDLSRFALSSAQASAYLSSSRSFFRQWAQTGWHGIDPKLTTEYPQCKQLKPGRAVATQDLRQGPLDDQEFETILTAINDGLESGIIELDRALELRLIAILGMRPAQLALAKCCDIQKDEHGRVVFYVPMVKGKHQAVRDQFLRSLLEPSTGEVLWAYRETLVHRFETILPDAKEAPLFPVVYKKDTATEVGLKYHTVQSAMINRIRWSLKLLRQKLPFASVRLNGETIIASSQRFRRSFAQRGADEGIDIFTLAHIMGHRTTDNVQVYFAVTDRIRARFSKKIAEQMAPLAAVFSRQLRILKDISEASRPIAASRIPDLRVDQHGQLKYLASCASCSECRQWRPYACLAGCQSFEPFLDADLEPIFDRMLAEREQVIEVDGRIATIRDRAIYGCAQIMLRQRELRALGGT